MANIDELYGRLAKDESTQRSLFTGLFTEVNTLELELAPYAQGTANFAIYENGEQKVEKRVTAGGVLSYTATVPNAQLEFYVNYYDESDLPAVSAKVS